jgi:8-oxo-dGTP diphosphatase
MKGIEKLSLAVDAIIERDNSLLFIKRRKGTFKGALSFPGGKVDVGEKVEDAVKRETLEETSLNIEPLDILGVYSDPKRDPRRHKISITFIARVISGKAKAGDDAESVEWLSINNKRNFAFDHNKILEDYRKWRKTKGTYWSSKIG